MSNYYSSGLSESYGDVAKKNHLDGHANIDK